MSQVEMEPKIAGRNITMTLSPLPSSRRKPRFINHPPPSKPGETVPVNNGQESAAE
jgi:hypothetical protein